MLVLNPWLVTFNQQTWQNVTAVLLNRTAAKENVEWSDMGPHVAMADVPEQRITIKVIQTLDADDLDAAKPADAGTLTLHTSPAASDARRKRISAQVVITRVEHEISLKRGAVRTVTMVAISTDGLTDPILVENDPEGGGA